MYKLIFCALLLSTGVVSSTDALSEPPRKSIYEVIRKQADRVYASGDYRHAVLLNRRYYARYADAPTAQRLADCYWQIGYYDSAMTYLQRCDKSSEVVRARMAEIHARKGAYTEAINEYDALMKMGTEKQGER
ncbi:MAG: tetratricopeptide repeat protein [Sediminibacterium sp.]